ncbi:MAG: DUF924 family protein [Burkholderiaceae bacterium]|nr:DUF924 family protein [Burkholderiaceae bacterium]
MNQPAEVLDFWFGAPGSAEAGKPRAQWFAKNAGFDAQIAERFGATIERALAGELSRWGDEHRSALALVIVLDQFTRNVYRDTPGAFSGDAQALALARALVDRGWDARLAPLERVFCYLPFEHSEDIVDQCESLRLFATLREDAQAGANYEWALKHYDIVERFGRFPHRNEILGRDSTPQEIEFLRQGGSRF